MRVTELKNGKDTATATTDSDEARKERIKQLKEKARELAGGEMVGFSSGNLPLEVEEQFWANVIAFETAPTTTLLEKLAQDSVILPTVDDLSDEDLEAKLWEVFRHLAGMQTFVHSTDHLSDRELYRELLENVLPEEMTDIVHPDQSYHVDLIGSGSEEDIHLYLKFYADEADRERWRREFPEQPLPEHVDLPYDRDRYLPKSPH